MPTFSRQVHGLAWELPSYGWRQPTRTLPTNGIYLVFEGGETTSLPKGGGRRITRVGSHRRNGRFPGRITQHYGSRERLGGNKNASVFRKHLGGALLRRKDPADRRLEDWLLQDGSSFAEVEEAVSRYMRERITYTFIEIGLQEERLELESALIATLAQLPIGLPSPQWLGRHAATEAIRKTGLWNTQHVGSQSLTADQFRRLVGYVRSTAYCTGDQ